MAIANLVSVEQYLHSAFEPDAEYVEGRIVERPLPQKPHSRMQGFLLRALHEAAHPLGYEIWVEQRIRTRRNPDHYRVPDLCVTLGEPPENTFTDPPALCIEILSPEDSALAIRQKVEEYLAFGVPHVWVIDPVLRTGMIHSGGGTRRADDGLFQFADILCDLSEM